MGRRTRAELEAENLILYRALEEIRDRLDELLDEEGEAEDDESDEGHEDDAGDDAESED